MLNLGDHLSGPLWAAETADLLLSLSGWVHIRGNHDRLMAELNPAAMGASDRAAAEELGDKHRAWLCSLPPTQGLEGGILLCHGTPERDDEYLVEDVSAGFARLAEPSVIRARAGSPAGLILCGHSHLPQFVQLDDSTLVANPGSVGLGAYDDPEHRFPHIIEAGSPHARYLLLDRDARGWRAELRLVEYDWESAARRAEAGGRPEWAYALRTGFFRR